MAGRRRSGTTWPCAAGFCAPLSPAPAHTQQQHQQPSPRVPLRSCALQSPACTWAEAAAASLEGLVRHPCAVWTACSLVACVGFHMPQSGRPKVRRVSKGLPVASSGMRACDNMTLRQQRAPPATDLLEGGLQVGGHHEVRQAEGVARDVCARGEVRLQSRQALGHLLRRGFRLL